ncbi:hypothetical protein BH18CHL2_BH18CHL2_11690 [soil metagenome]
MRGLALLALVAVAAGSVPAAANAQPWTGNAQQPDSPSSRPGARTASLGAVPSAAVCVSSSGPGIPPPASVPAGLAGFHAHWYGQSGYPSLCPGERSTAVVAFYNSGSRGWVDGRMGEVAYLGTWVPEPGQDRPSILGGDGTRDSPATGWPRYDRVAVQPASYVGPGQVAWFQFTVQAPPLAGTYRLAIRPLIEGAAWLEDFGVFWYVTVLKADGSPPPAVGPAGTTPVALARPDFAEGAFERTRAASGGIALTDPFTSGTWTSSWIAPGFGFSELIASWNAETPAGSWIEIAMQATPDGLRPTRWWILGRWAHGDADIARTSVPGQSDDDGRINVDTFLAGPQLMRAYRLRATLSRPAPGGATPVVTALAAAASDGPNARPRIPSAPTGVPTELAVPRYSQEVHAGEYPEFDGGGEAWCSPTSIAMVVAYWGRGPAEGELAAIPYADPQVDHAARYTFDAAYSGTGNWPFNTAYAATFGLRAFVTQLRSLTEAEAFLQAGIPLIASITVGSGTLPGFLFGQGTGGHLLVIAGFTAAGDVIANDPAALSNASVRRVYPRAAFERSWLTGSHGVVYVIHPASTPLPPTPAGYSSNW